MQITINIDSSNFGETVGDIFKSISPEKKEELALSIIREWLNEPVTIEKSLYEETLIQKFRSGELQLNNNYYGTRDTSDKGIRGNYEFQKELEKFKSTKQGMLEDIRKEIVEVYKKSISEEIAVDEKINELKESTYNELVKMFPELMFKTLVNIFSSGMGSFQKIINDSAQYSNTINEMHSNIYSNLRRKE